MTKSLNTSRESTGQTTESPFKWMSQKTWNKLSPTHKVAMVDFDYSCFNDYGEEFDMRGNLIVPKQTD